MTLLKVQGIIQYDPIARAIGTRKTAKLRPYVSRLFSELQKHNLSSDEQRVVEYYCRQIKQDPELLTRQGPQAVASAVVHKIYDMCLAQNPTLVMASLLSVIDKAMIITSIRSNWAIVSLPVESIQHAREQIFSEYKQKPAIPSWGPHVTIIRGEKHLFPALRDQEQIEITYNSEIRKGKTDYFFFDVICPELEELRVQQGLSRNPTPDLHITIGPIR